MSETSGRYKIYEVIGEGGFAIVYRGHDTTLDRPVALKELRPILLQDKSWVKRFRQEARTIARLDHPHIVPIFDIHNAQERLFIVMRLIEGESLEDHISKQGKLPWPDVVETITCITAGLEYAHNQRVLHRDLKPANIMMDTKRGPMLSDFGLAKMVGEHSMSMSESGSVVGTPHYIAPEVWEGKGASHQSDIYALGCILFEMLTGEKVIKGETPPAVMMAHFKPLMLPDVWPIEVPPGISMMLRKALAQQPEDRYATALEMSQELQTLATDKNSLSLRDTFQPPNPVLTKDLQSSTPNESAKGSQLAAPHPPTAVPLNQPHPHVSSPVPAQPDRLKMLPDATPPVLTPQPGSPPHLLPTDSQNAPIGYQHKRSGCLSKGIVTSIVILLLIFVGLTSFCAAIGGNLGNNLGVQVEHISALLKNSVTINETITEPIDIPVPNEADITRLEIAIAADRFHLSSGAKNSLVDGTVTYNVDLLKPKITTNSQTVRLTHEGTTQELFLISAYSFFNTEIENIWDLRLGNTPTALSIDTGTAEGTVELGQVSLTDMTVSQGVVGSFDLSFTEPNEVEMETLEFNGGATKRSTLIGLAYARANNIHFTPPIGEAILDFSGLLQNDIKVNIVGDNNTLLTIIIPEGTNAEIVTNRNIQTTDIPNNWEGSGKAYTMYGTGHQIFIEISAPAQSLKVRTQ